jgi:serine/threonine protein kinase
MERVRSPYVVGALSHGVIEGRIPEFWIEMPLMGGQTLAEARGVGLEEGLRLCVGVWQGLLALHEAGVAHRDLKPANVLLTAGGEPRVCDFGLSKQVGGAETVTRTGDAFGTPQYMSPEATRGEAVGLAADVWSFGVLVCEVLGGRLPFAGRVASEVWASILRDEPDISAVPERFRAGVQECLSKELARRPADARALRGGLVA